MKWTPPEAACLVFYVDGSVLRWSGKAGIGGVLRNSMGETVCSFSAPVDELDVSTVELLAINKACSMCVSRCSVLGKNIVFCSDSSNAVSWVNDKDFGNLSLWDLIADFRAMLIFLGNSDVVSCPRESNEAGDSLAKKGSALEEEVIEWNAS